MIQPASLPLSRTAMPWRVVLAIIGAVLVRPQLWTVAFRQVVRTAAPRWWARVPFLPLPRGDYLRFRLVTQYGTADGQAIRVDDVISYLAWCRGQHSVRQNA